jgi:hypothetical protein
MTESMRWKTSIADLPCTVELGKGGAWVVTIASASVGCSHSLVEAIIAAGGGLVSRDEAEALEASLASRRPLTPA